MAEKFTEALQQALNEIKTQAPDGGVNEGSGQTSLPTTMNPRDMNW